MGRFTHVGAVVTLAAAILVASGGCNSSPEPKGEAKKASLTREGDLALTAMREADPGLESFLADSHGYAIFPSVGKGGLIVGGAFGRGEVYEMGRHVGYANITEASVGAQVGGQTFHELIVFQNQAAMDRFKRGDVAFGANASAVALKAGAARGTTFKDGMAVFTKPEGGAMVEASIGGQRFKYEPLETAGSTATTQPSR